MAKTKSIRSRAATKCTRRVPSDGSQEREAFMREAALASARIEIRRQLRQGYALVTAAHQILGDTAEEADAKELLNMAEDLLSDLKWINRLDSEVAHA